MQCPVYQIKIIETKGSKYPCSEYSPFLSLHQIVEVGGRLWVMSFVSLGNTFEIQFTKDFLTTFLLLCLLFYLLHVTP